MSDMYLVEEHEFVNGTLTDIPFRRVVKAAGFKIAFAAASRIAAKRSGRPFDCNANDLVEVVEGYLWGYGDAGNAYEVRRLTAQTGRQDVHVLASEG